MATSRSVFAAACLGLVLLASLAEFGDGQVRSDAKLDAGYTVTLLGIPIGRLSWTIDIRDKEYSAAASGSTLGLLRIFAGGHGTANAQGVVSATEPVASNFVVDFVSGNSSDEVRIAFSGGKAKEILAHPPKPNPNLVPLTDAHRTGVVDPMTALLIRVPGSGDLAAPAACEHKVPVFDGHMRYDLRLTFKRLEQVKAATGYQGPVVVCGVNFSPVAGYDPTRFAIKYLMAQRDIELWLAPLDGTRLMVPFRVSLQTPLGLGVLQATRFVWTRPIARSSAMNAD